MRARRGLERIEDLCSGPGKLTQALAIDLDLNGSELDGGPIAIEPAPPGWEEVEPVVGTRSGSRRRPSCPGASASGLAQRLAAAAEARGLAR